MSNRAWDNANLVWANNCKCKGGSVGAYIGVPPGKDYATHIPVCGRCGTDWVLKKRRKVVTKTG